MKKFLGLFMAIAIFVIAPLMVFAQDAVVSGAAVVAVDAGASLPQVVEAFIKFAFSIKGATTLAISLGLIQLILMGLKSQDLANSIFKKLDAATKASIVHLLTIVVSVLSAMIAGVPFLTAVMAPAVLLPLQEYLFQLYKNYLAKKNA